MATKFRIEYDDTDFQGEMAKLQRYMNTVLPTEMYNEYKINTPIESGNARRKTRLVYKRDAAEIRADYDYATVLDQGLYPNPPKAGKRKTVGGYSKQAPRGMATPTLEKAQELVYEYVRKI